MPNSLKSLLPCPFCGSKNIDASGWSSKNASGPACDDCGAAAGSTHDSHDDNITAWNTRAPIAEGGGDHIVDANKMVSGASEAGDWADWKGLLLALVTERPKRCRNHHGDAPGHSHSIPGVWDSDNGILAGKECAWCKAWREAETYLAIAAAPAPGGGK